MMLSLYEQLRQINLPTFEVFERAYAHEFGIEGFINPEYCTFVQTGIMPQYVINYLLFLRSTS
jgi:hypothetical protein